MRKSYRQLSRSSINQQLSFRGAKLAESLRSDEESVFLFLKKAKGPDCSGPFLDFAPSF